MSGKKPQEKSKTFRGGINLETVIVLIVPLIVSSILFWYGVRNDRLFPPSGSAIWRKAFVYGPMIFGGIIILISLVTLISNMFVKITVTPEKIYYKHFGKEFECKWRILAFAPPPKNKKFFRYFTISDGTVLARVYSAFFPKFDMVVKFIQTAKGKASKAGYEV